MTTPEERTRAVIELERAVLALVSEYGCGKTATVRVPRDRLHWLRLWLRHYPTPSDLRMSADTMPYVWGQPGESKT